VVLALLLGVACTTPKLVGSSDGGRPAFRIPDPGVTASPPPGVHPNPPGPGVDLIPIHIPEFVFGSPTPHPVVQSGSASLMQLLGTRARLEVVALPSAPGTAAVDFTELSPPGHRWGEVMFPAERAVFRAFAADASLGSYLVVLTDVAVLRRPDPIPVTAYRWRRIDVEAYAGCGIPNAKIDGCTVAFYQTADSRIVGLGGGPRGV
jgi:hypothetical protein